MVEQNTLFDLDELIEDKSSNTKKVTRCSFLEERDMTVEELFADKNGNHFTSLYAVTYSADLNFINQIIKDIDYVEVVFGNKNVMNTSTKEIVIAQAADCSFINKKVSKYASERIKLGTLRFWVANGINSHDKFYVLSNDMFTRVITGSANFSSRAFKSKQREGIYYDDSVKGYEIFLKRFNEYKDFCSSEIDYRILKGKELKDDEVLENIPLFNNFNDTIVIDTVKNAIEENKEREIEIEYTVDLNKWEKKINNVLPKNKAFKLQKKQIKDAVSNFRKEEAKEQEIIKEHPQLILDYETKSASFNNKKLNLKPERNSIIKDINLYMEYMNGFDSFYGNIEKDKEIYFKIAVWLFASPFIPYLRYQAQRWGCKIERFPVFGLIYGESDGGKTSYTNLIIKMMAGVEIVATPAKGNFTYKKIDNFRYFNKGIPILIDDIAYGQYISNAGKIVKDDNYSIQDSQNCYPSIILTSNDVDTLKAEFVKRIIPFRISIQNNKENTEKNFTKFAYIKKDMTNNFYCEYIRRMFEKVEQMVVEMVENYETVVNGNHTSQYLPDVFKISSETVIEIFNDLDIEVPDYIKIFSYNDYFGDQIIAEKSIEVFKDTFRNMPDAFRVNRKKNLLTYTSYCPDSNRSYEKDNDVLFNYINELPRKLKAKQNNKTLVFDLKETEKLLNMKFSNNSLYNKIFNHV